MAPSRKLPLCTNQADCRHPGGILPYEKHDHYDIVLSKELRKTPFESIMAVLGIDLVQYRQLCIKFNKAYRDVYETDALIEGVPLDLTGGTMVDWVLQLVKQLHSSMLDYLETKKSDGSLSSQITENQTYLRAALYTLIMVRLKGKIEGRMCKEKSQATAEHDEKLVREDIKNRLGVVLEWQQACAESVQELRRKNDSLLRADQKPDELILVTPTASRATDQADAHVNGTASMGIQSTPASGAAQGEQQVDQAGTAASGPDQVAQEQSRHRANENACDSTEAQLRTAMLELQQVKKALDDRERRIVAFAEENSKAANTIMKLEFDNAELGCALAVLQSVERGDEVGVRTRLLCHEIGRDVVERLLENPKFRTNFLSSRKRKRDDEDIKLKAEI